MSLVRPLRHSSAGVAAAQAVLSHARVTAAEAVLGHWARLEWQHDASTVARPPEEILEAASAFTLAETVAIDTCCECQPAPQGCWLEVADA